jgi:5-hydroxyisourate hydrolase
MELTPPGVKGRLTTHVLDTSTGNPASGVQILLFRLFEERIELLLTTRTNADGRCDAPLLAGAALVSGIFELVFEVGDYFRTQGMSLPEPAFLDRVPVRFGISDRDRHYHVPLLIAPFGYATYRGS